MNTDILVTGAAGFVGAHAAAALADRGWRVTGCDSFNDYYDPALKHHRVQTLLAPRGVPCVQADLADPAAVQALFDQTPFTHVLHLAAQAGVRDAAEAPEAYVQSNLVGFGHVIEACRRRGVQHLVYASSSSVYGVRSKVPFHEDDDTVQPASLYAATKRSNELVAHAYAHRFGLHSTGLRFFTVYGPWGRPDMAYFSFARALRAGQPITVYGEGKLQRDFTYIDDIVESMCRLLDKPCAFAGQADPTGVFNIGNRHPVTVSHFVELLEAAVGHKAVIRHAPMPPDDVPITCADTTRLEAFTGFQPDTPLKTGLERFAAWLQTWEPTPP
ncbi:MAG: NAD-dependent epimerase/dehydratase family protein [Burkholderiales bacterium]